MAEDIITTRHKRGDTFRYRFVLTENDSPVDLTNIGIKSQIRFGSTLIAELVVTKLPEEGHYELFFANTQSWPLKTVTCDVEYTLENGDVQSTETFAFELVRDVTVS